MISHLFVFDQVFVILIVKKLVTGESRCFVNLCIFIRQSQVHGYAAGFYCIVGVVSMDEFDPHHWNKHIINVNILIFRAGF